MAVKSIKDQEDLVHVVQLTDLFPLVDKDGKNPKGVTAAQITRATIPDVEINKPVWLNIPLQNWVTGQTVSLSLSDYVVSPDDSPITYTYISGSLPTSNGAEMRADSAGDIDGTVDAGQGGTYEIIYNATNASGSVSQVLPAIVVGLEITAPVWSTTNPVQDFTQEAGEQFYLDLNDHIDSDGDPNGVSALSFTYTHSVAAPPTLDFNISGIVSGITTTEATVNTITVTCWNASGLSSTETFDITVSAIGGGSETPLMASFESGYLACVAAVKPVWKLPVDFNVTIGEVVAIDMVTNYIADTGGTAIAAMALDGGSAALPTGLDTTTTLGWIKGTVGGSADTFPVELTATNSTLQSDASGSFNFIVTDAATVIPTINSIDAVIDSNKVYVNFSEACDTSTNYLSGITITVNGVTRDISGGPIGNVGTSRWYYTLGGLALTQSNIINVVYSDSEGGFNSVATGQQVADADISYTVPVPPIQGVIAFADFEDGTFTFKTGNATWKQNLTNVEVSNENPRTGNYSLRCAYPVENANGYSYGVEVDFFLADFYPDLWCKYDLFIPANYVHDPNTQGNGDNNKFYNVWAGTYDSADREGPSLLVQTNPTSDLVSLGVLTSFSQTANKEWSCTTCGAGKMSNCITQNDIGHWMTLVIHSKYATEAQYLAQLALDGTYEYDEGDGVFQIWKTDWEGNTSSRLNVQTGGWYGTRVDRVTPARGFDKGRFLGWCNAGFAEETVFYIDNVTFSTEPLI